MSDNSSTGSSTRGTVRAPRRKRRPGGRPFPLQPIEERHRIAAAKLAQGAAIRPTLMEAGYSVHTASRGIDALRHAGPVARAVQERLDSQSDTVALAPERQVNLIQNKLLENIALGRDRALGSLTTLGRIRNMLAPENQTLVQVNVAAPSQAASQWEDTEPDAQPATPPATVTTK